MWQHLVTVGEPARAEIAEFTLRPKPCNPAPSAEKLLVTGFADGWTHLDGLGVAVRPRPGRMRTSSQGVGTVSAAVVSRLAPTPAFPH